MATATKTAKGFQVTCPFCGDVDATLNLDINDVRKVCCSSCDAEFTPAAAVAKAAEQLKRWQAVAAWIEMAAELAAE